MAGGAAYLDASSAGLRVALVDGQFGSIVDWLELREADGDGTRLRQKNHSLRIWELGRAS